MIKIESNIQSVTANLSNLDQIFRIGVASGLTSLAERFVKAAKTGIQNSPKSYRPYTYTGGGRRFRTRSSSPGAYPAFQTGRLAKTIDFKMQGKFKVVVGAGMLYSIFLENGTSKMNARPILSKTHKLNNAKFVTILVNEMNEALGV